MAQPGYERVSHFITETLKSSERTEDSYLELEIAFTPQSLLDAAKSVMNKSAAKATAKNVKAAALKR